MISAEHITVAYDGSPQSELALRRGLLMTAGSRVAQVHVVCVAQVEGRSLRLPRGARLPSLVARQWLEHVVTRTSRDVPSTQGTLVLSHLRTGNAARAIVDLAYRYHTERILIGAGGSNDRIGSVAQAVLDLSEIPVDLQGTLGPSLAERHFNPLRFAYVFGGPELVRHAFGTRH
jgi:nucleotide-binding universal stress UspA family protein